MIGKVLVVDDEMATRQSLADILRLEGCQVMTAEDGERAVEYLQKESFDLILLDLKMPGMDGLDVLHITAKIAPDTQIILLTAQGSLESAIEALRYGAKDYLLKPSSPDQILRSVSNGLKRRTETEQKHFIVDQLEASIKQLKEVEGRDASVDANAKASAPSVITIGPGIFVDLDRREIWQDDQRISLTPTEGKFLRVLLNNQKKVFTHRELVSMVQGYETSNWEAPEVLRPMVSRLRRKLAVFPGGENWIVNVRGTGYVFEGEEKRVS